jgi:hypothetical protein
MVGWPTLRPFWMRLPFGDTKQQYMKLENIEANSDLFIRPWPDRCPENVHLPVKSCILMDDGQTKESIPVLKVTYDIDDTTSTVLVPLISPHHLEIVT